MSKAIEQIESKIIRLPRKLQLEVVERLNARLWPTGFDPAMEDAWAGTVKRRLDEVDSGKVEGVSASRVFARAQRLLARR